ncbi:MAG TPA: maleylpyruvate isomerase family mycothiol-dependent enzyme [Micromonosporaceae bacterium]|nr:maleylpyruvate isomerase family mycothiol-dependent enzyme [Micromonosporaceae bacterium]
MNDDAAAACAQSLSALLALAEELAEDAWDRPTDCPAWTVGQVYAHIAGIERWLADGGIPITGPLQSWIDSHVAERAGYSREQTLRELRVLVPARLAQLAAPPAEAYAPFVGTVSASVALSLRAFDLWVHEQDIRYATGHPGNLGSPGAHLTGRLIIRSLPKVVAKTAGAPPASSVRLIAGGEVPIDVTIAVDASGRGRLAPPDGTAATTVIRMSWPALARLGAGRGSPADHAITVSGDTDLGHRVIANLNIAP